MADYVLAVKREFRGKAPSSADVASGREGIAVKGSANPNRVVIGGSRQAIDQFRANLDDRYVLEPLTERRAF